MSTYYSPAKFSAHALELMQCGQELAALGWTPATSSNFSMRIDAEHIAITISGRDKGHLVENDIMVVNNVGQAVGSDHRPSAETLLHIQLYTHDPEIGCVLHTHSPTQTVASRLFAADQGVELADYELLKAFDGNITHATRITVPIFPNSQDIVSLARKVDYWLASEKPLYGYLIASHGIYTWGRNMKEARRHLDAFEFLLACELDLRRLRG